MTENMLTPPLGSFHDVNGRRVWLHTAGEGGPTVVFLPGASAIGLDYYTLHLQVAEFTTSVIYDRGGSGYSDPMPLPRTADEVAAELHDMLHAQGIPGPYILAAHSLGGAYAHGFARLFPDEVAGLVWLDAFHRDWDRYVPEELSLAASERLAPTREQLEQALPFMREFVAQALGDFPEKEREALLDYHVSDTWIDVGIAERASMTALAAELADGPGLPDVPFIALTPLGVDPNQAALMSPELLQAMHDGKRRHYDDLAAAFTHGENRILADTNHSELCFDRADAIIAAIRDVIDLAAQPAPATDRTEENTAMTVTLSDQDQATLRIAAYGAVTLMTFAGVASSPHKIATHGSLALTSATGVVGHVLSENPKGKDLKAKSAAALADRVLPALTESMRLLKRHSPAEADNFRETVTVAVRAAVQAHRGEPTPPMTDMVGKITGALNAA